GPGEIRQQRDRRAVGESTGGGRRVDGGRASGGSGRCALELLAGRVRGDGARGGIHDDGLAALQRRRCGSADDRDDALLPGEDRGVRGRSAVGGDQGEYLAEVQQCCVGRGEVARDEDER